MSARRQGTPLALAITLALLLKFVLLGAIYQLSFSAPLAKKMRMPGASVEQHLLGAPPPRESHDPRR